MNKSMRVVSIILVTVLVAVLIMFGWAQYSERVRKVQVTNEALLGLSGDISSALSTMKKQDYNSGKTSLYAEQARANVKAKLGEAFGSWRAISRSLEDLGMAGEQVDTIGYIMSSMAVSYSPPIDARLKVPDSTLNAIIRWYSLYNSILANAHGNYVDAMKTHGKELIDLYKTFQTVPVITEYRVPIS